MSETTATEFPSGTKVRVSARHLIDPSQTDLAVVVGPPMVSKYGTSYWIRFVGGYADGIENGFPAEALAAATDTNTAEGLTTQELAVHFRRVADDLEASWGGQIDFAVISDYIRTLGDRDCYVRFSEWSYLTTLDAFDLADEQLYRAAVRLFEATL